MDILVAIPTSPPGSDVRLNAMLDGYSFSHTVPARIGTGGSQQMALIEYCSIANTTKMAALTIFCKLT